MFKTTAANTRPEGFGVISSEDMIATKGPAMMPAGRRCSFVHAEGGRCNKPLSQYNKTDQCHFHGTPRFSRHDH